MQRIVTLCGECAELFSEAYRVKKYSFEKATTQPLKACEYCGCRGGLEMYIVDTSKEKQ